MFKIQMAAFHSFFRRLLLPFFLFSFKGHLVKVVGLEVIEGRQAAQEGRAAARHHALGQRGLREEERVVNEWNNNMLLRLQFGISLPLSLFISPLLPGWR